MKVTASQILSLSQYLPNKQSDFGRYLLPSILLCRLDELLKETKVRILDALASFEDGTPVIAKSRAFQKISGRNFYNVSRLDLASCLSDPSNLKANLNLYIQGFDDDTRDVFEKFSFQALFAALLRIRPDWSDATICEATSLTTGTATEFPICLYI